MTASQQTINRLAAVHPNRVDLGVCVAPLRPTGGCMDRAEPGVLVRADFHIVILCSGGSADQVVDLARHHHESGALVWIRPGHVHELPPAVEGTVVCFTDAFVGSETSLSPGPVSWNLGSDDLGDVRAHLAVLQGEYERFVFGPTGPHLAQGEAMLRLLLRAFLIRIGQAPALLAGQTIEPHPVARAFLTMVERSFATIHTVEAYAGALGYSSKTLERASVEATGLSPKQVIDGRLVLEARRLLAYTNLPVSRVGSRLGFVDPANFCKFFLRATEMSPGAYRASRQT
ncbi:helix-turn-helix domain-containing protein [Pengzhenrongella frigida]|uniref:AraC family transcriptional regulator n=1 Tax=Pengzhenrongella frigida TaxID=1259133 RepID=A0A4Q5MZV1_9MICO|nr:helix-turn-helix transcriptional regulator [Cellulomonas sp. HLT2-17]RYV51279.1 AraC family transcriptional regulator [Cellulomonas sp. HLT2-17]